MEKLKNNFAPFISHALFKKNIDRNTWMKGTVIKQVIFLALTVWFGEMILILADDSREEFGMNWKGTSW